jgi:hypothetical protein
MYVVYDPKAAGKFNCIVCMLIVLFHLVLCYIESFYSLIPFLLSCFFSYIIGVEPPNHVMTKGQDTVVLPLLTY